MGVAITYKVDGMEDVRTSLDRFDLGERDFNPLWNSLAGSFAHYMRRQFSTFGAEMGEPWQRDQSARYLEAKEAVYPGKPLMRASDELYNSLTRRPFGVERFGKHEMEVGTDVYHGKIHQRGVPEGTRMVFKIGNRLVVLHGLPKRKTVGMNQSMRTSWRKKMQRYIVRGQTSSGEER